MKKDITHKFTDEHFRRMVQDFVGHETIYQEDIEGVDELYVFDCPCKELNGLEYFTGLKELRILKLSRLTSLIIPELPRLEKLDVWENELLSSLAIPESPNLKYLEVHYNNSLTSLTIPELPRLERLYVRGNESLTSLTIPELPNLQELYIKGNNSLTSLTIPERFKSITKIECNYTDIVVQ